MINLKLDDCLSTSKLTNCQKGCVMKFLEEVVESVVNDTVAVASRVGEAVVESANTVHDAVEPVATKVSFSTRIVAHKLYMLTQVADPAICDVLEQNIGCMLQLEVKGMRWSPHARLIEFSRITGSVLLDGSCGGTMANNDDMVLNAKDIIMVCVVSPEYADSLLRASPHPRKYPRR